MPIIRFQLPSLIHVQMKSVLWGPDNFNSKLLFSPQTLIKAELRDFSTLQAFIIDKFCPAELQDHTWTAWQTPEAPYRCP